MTCAELMADDTNDTEQIFANSMITDIQAKQLPTLTYYVDNVCEYIAGFVVRKLLNRLKCDPCRLLLLALPEELTGTFLELRDQGGLVKAAPNVVAVVREAEKCIRMLVATEKPANSISRLGARLEHSVIHSILDNKAYKFTDHSVETTDGFDNHEITLVRQIVRLYLDIRKFHILKTWNLARTGRNIRQIMTKTVLFKNQ
jgi:hypothetical protein